MQKETGQDVEELRNEVARQREEVLRLRDLLIGKDAELGHAKGKLTELEDRSERLMNALGRLQAIAPRFLWAAFGALRRLRSRG